MTCILAGNYQEYKNWIKKNHPELIEDFYFINCKYHYCDEAQQIMGAIVDDVIIIGTFWQRKDADEIYQQAKSRANRNKK